MPSRWPFRRRSDATHARLILETANDAFVGIDVSGAILDWNRAAETTFGWTYEEVRGRQLVDLLIPERFRDAHRGGIERYLETGEGPVLFRKLELPALHADGHELRCEVTIWPSQDRGGLRFNAFLRDITRQSRLRDRFALVQRITAAANAATDLEWVTTKVIDEVCELTNWPVGHVYLVDDEDTLIPTGWWNPGSSRFQRFMQATQGRTFEVGQGLPGRVAVTGRPNWIADLREDPDFPRSAEAIASGLVAGLAFPVLSGDRTVAVLEFFTAQPTPPDQDLIELLADVGTQVGRVFERVRMQEELERAAEFRARITSMVSHELRSPLSAIHGFARLLETEWDRLEEDTKREFATSIARQSSRVVALISDLLTLSRLEAGSLEPKPDTVPLVEVISETITDYDLRGVDIDASVDLAVRADRDHVVRMMANYLVNAVNHGTPPIQVRAWREDGDVEIQVRDAGLGVPEDFRDRLFQRFARANPSDPQGTGLGLSIVRALAEMNGGEAWYEPVEPTGASFHVRLPAA